MSQTYSYTCTLSQELQEMAKTELNENPETRDQEIQTFREKVIANKALRCPRDSAFLLRFLRARKFEQERAYQMLINYYTVRANNSQHLKTLTPAHSKNVIDTGFSFFLPSTDKLGRRIIYLRFGKWNPEEMEMMKFLRLNLLTLEQSILDEPTQIKGIVCIANVVDMGLNHIKNVDVNYMRTMSFLTQDAFPMRFKGMHFVNEPAVFGYMHALIRPFLSEKTKARQNFHGPSLESLQQFFELSSLPEELGGSLGSGDDLADSWKKELYGNEKYFEGMTAYKIDLEADLFKDSKAASDVDSSKITGTFKKLDI